STNQGASWDPARPSRFPSSNAPGTFLRLSTGEVVLAWNNHVESVYARQSLVLAGTRDGKTFYGFREIDHTDFFADRDLLRTHVTYPYLCEAPDGYLLISYNHGLWAKGDRARLARVEPGWLEQKHEFDD